MTLRTVLTRVLVTALLAQSTACGWFDDQRPNEAHIDIDGTPGARVRLITSSTFVAATTETGITQVTVITSDTAWPALPFQATHQIAADQRFLVEVSRFEVDLDSVRVRVFVDEDEEFNEGGALLTDRPYLFVYTFNQPITSVVNVVF